MMHVLKSDAPLIVYLDVKSPYAFVAVRPTLALERALGLQFDWRPLTLDVPSYLGSARKQAGQVVDSVGRSPATWRAIRYGYSDARRYAQRQGLTIKGTEKIWDSSIANIALLWVNATDREVDSNIMKTTFLPSLSASSADTAPSAAGASPRLPVADVGYSRVYSAHCSESMGVCPAFASAGSP